MNEINPFESPSARPDLARWRPIDWFVVGLWIAIPLGVFAARVFLRPVFTEFEVALSGTTEYLLTMYAWVPFALASAAVTLTMVSIGPERRNRLTWVAAIVGGIVGLICLGSLLVPLVSLWLALA